MTTSSIDELQRLHEAATKGTWSPKLYIENDIVAGRDTVAGNYDYEDGGIVKVEDRDHIVALHNAWPAIHRVLVAAREVAGNTADDIDERLRYVEVRPGRDEWRELIEALRALDEHQD